MRGILTLTWPLFCAIPCFIFGWVWAGFVFLGVFGGILYSVWIMISFIATGTLIIPDHPDGDPYNQVSAPINDTIFLKKDDDNENA